MKFFSLPFATGGKRKDIPISDDAYEHLFSQTAYWREIYEGGGDWRYARKGGLDGGSRRLNSLGAAKSLCRQLSALCFSQQAEIACGGEKTTAYVADVLQQNSFWDCFPQFLEKTLALGSGVIKTYVDGGRVKLNYIGGDCFIPTDYDSGGVYGGIIVSRMCRDGKEYALLEQHERTDDGYVITNTLYENTSSSWKEIPLGEMYPELQARTEIRNIRKPLFTYFRTIGGNVLGESVFAGAIDTLKSLDIVFDSLEREFVLGKKRIIVPVSAIRGEYDDNGKLRRYFDSSDEVYQAFSADDNEELKITDNSTELRVTEHKEALETLLDLLCMQTGLSQGTLSYHSDTAKTAAEVISRNDKTHRTKTAQQQLLREGLITLAENIAMLGMSLGEIPPEDVTAEVIFSDSISKDNNTVIDTTLKLYNAGLIDKEKAMAEIYGI